MKPKKRRYPKLLYLLTAVLFLVLAGISLWSNSLRIPANSLPAPDELNVYPATSADNLVLPYNIAPMNFKIGNEAYDYITCFSSDKGKPILIKGNDVRIHERRWKKMLEINKGNTIQATVYVKRDGVWFHFPTIRYQIAPEPIDTWVVYRMVQPSFTELGSITLVQRNLESFEEKVLFKKSHINQTNEQSLTQSLFPACHPKLPLLACAVNRDGDFISLLDREIAHPFNNGSYIQFMTTDKNAKTTKPTKVSAGVLEAFPSWNQNGTLLFSSISVPVKRTGVAPTTVQFNLTRRRFDPSTASIGPADTLLNASLLGKSAILPSISPDGNHLLFCLTETGNAPIWNNGCDLCLMNTENWTWQKLDILNSPEADNQACWSSNGRWIIFCSDREDGCFARLYIAYLDKEGMVHKPFALPQRHPEYNQQVFQSCNTPECIPERTATSQLRMLVYWMDQFDKN